MKKIISLALLIMLICLHVTAQPGKTDIDSLMKKLSPGKPAWPANDTKPDSSGSFFPARKNKLLDALPIRTFTKAELISYLHNLNAVLTEFMRNSYGKDLTGFPETALKMTGTGIAFWLDGETGEGALIALNGAELTPDNITLLNNAGGMLTGSGLGYNAIPILQYALDKQPGNNMILNNLGQAYLQLGDDKKAEQYFQQCVSSYPDYPDANLALAYIYRHRGNQPGALKYGEHSLRGGWSEGAYNLVTKLKPDAKLMDYIRHRYQQPETFNFNKYPLLPQCRDTKSTPLLQPQYKAYKQMLALVQKKYAELQKQEEEAAKKSVPDKIAAYRKLNRSPYRPFGIFANALLINMWTNDYHDRFIRFLDYKKNYLAQKEKLIADCLAEQKAITNQYKEQKDAASEADGEGADNTAYDKLTATICAAKEKVRNRYLNLIADAIEAYQQKAIHLYKDYFNDMSFWYYVGSIDDHQYKAEFYGLVSSFLDMLAEINTTHFYKPCQFTEDAEGKATEAEPIEEPECFIPGVAEIHLGALILELSCESYKIEAGEGLVGKIEYNRSSGDFTLALGVGAAVPRVLYKTPGFKVGLEGEAKSQLYITFDKQGNPTDLGILWEAKLKLLAEMAHVKYGGEMEERLTAGFGSGVNMNDDGQLKAAIDKTFPVQPEAKQMNKNVPLYKNKM